ncbi:hypothetical protein RB195_015468 [Necator americanus]|uniref:Uncharacterized protein n=1 Tax=Necator americanus TaxID=51031 RepID=A0ABR1E4T8_NECAM
MELSYIKLTENRESSAKRNVIMAALNTDKAFVVKNASAASFVLVVNKTCLIGNFAPSLRAPQIGAVIVIEWSFSSNECINRIDIINWNPYNGYNTMALRLASETTDPYPKFIGSFYTCGCIRYKEVPLTNPAIFNDVIGVVDDSRGVLERKYIGKLWATVMYSDFPFGASWILCFVDKYMGETSDYENKFPYKGIVGAVNEGPRRIANYITSRDFPHDVRFFTGRDVGRNEADSLLGREVLFNVRKGDPGFGQSFYVLGKVETTENRSPVIIYDRYFALKLLVEHIGCTDEHGSKIVWSEQWEFIRDEYDLFGNRDYGIYRVEAIRQFKPDEFPRWKVKKILNVVKIYKSGKNDILNSQAALQYRRTRNTEYLKREGERSTFNEKNSDSGIQLEELDDNLTSRTSSRTSDQIYLENTYSDSKYRSSTDEETENELRMYMHKCLMSLKVRAAMKEANPELFEKLVKALMRRISGTGSILSSVHFFCHSDCVSPAGL